MKESEEKAWPAVEVCENFKLSPRAQPLLREDMNYRQLVAELVRHKLYADAIRSLVHRMTKQQTVWWGCLCARHVGGWPLPPKEEPALQAAVRWVLDPSDRNRRAAKAPADEATFETPAGCLAQGVFWSGGSLLPPDMPVVPPKPFLTGRVVGGAILMASVSPGGLKIPDVKERFLSLGFGVYFGKGLWK